MRVAEGRPRRPRPAITSPRTTTKRKVRGGGRGVPPVRIRGPRIEHEPEPLQGKPLGSCSELIAGRGPEPVNVPPQGPKKGW
jgi:hypothetical protein